MMVMIMIYDDVMHYDENEYDHVHNIAIEIHDSRFVVCGLL